MATTKKPGETKQTTPRKWDEIHPALAASASRSGQPVDQQSASEQGRDASSEGIEGGDSGKERGRRGIRANGLAPSSPNLLSLGSRPPAERSDSSAGEGTRKVRKRKKAEVDHSPFRSDAVDGPTIQGQESAAFRAEAARAGRGMDSSEIPVEGLGAVVGKVVDGGKKSFRKPGPTQGRTGPSKPPENFARTVAGKVPAGAKSILHGVGSVLKGGSDILVGTVGCLGGTAVCIYDTVAGVVKPTDQEQPDSAAPFSGKQTIFRTQT
ncbi:MAG: hypothetical protein HQL72_03905 [Magnetococcales bacterium]|nr:hypothetical protein [Magnetococcales bacterium]